MPRFPLPTHTRAQARWLTSWLAVCLTACGGGTDPETTSTGAGGGSTTDTVANTVSGNTTAGSTGAGTSGAQTTGGMVSSASSNSAASASSSGGSDVTASSTATTGATTGSAGTGGSVGTTDGGVGSTTTNTSGGSGDSTVTGAGGATSTTTTTASATTSTTATTGGDPSCRGGSDPDFALSGWATESGGTSGGKGGQTITVSTGTALAQALKEKQDSSTPLTILVEGSITPANSGELSKIDVKDVSDVSIIGAGSGAEFNGIGIKVVRASNIVLRNLKIYNVAIGDKDAISIEGPADHIWVDHCELHAEYQNVDKDHYDGLLDVKAESEYITYSWNYLHDSWKTALVGSSESDTFDRKLTMHHNYFRNCNSRLPLFRGGSGHVFNNLFEDVHSTAINSRLGACIRVENNSFHKVQNPWISAYSDDLGGVELVCNYVDGESDFALSGDDMHEPLDCTGVVPYDYDQVLTHVDHVAELVSTHAGVGKLSDPTDF